MVLIIFLDKAVPPKENSENYSKLGKNKFWRLFKINQSLLLSLSALLSHKPPLKQKNNLIFSPF